MRRGSDSPAVTQAGKFGIMSFSYLKKNLRGCDSSAHLPSQLPDLESWASRMWCKKPLTIGEHPPSSAIDGFVNLCSWASSKCILVERSITTLQHLKIPLVIDIFCCSLGLSSYTVRIIFGKVWLLTWYTIIYSLNNDYIKEAELFCCSVHSYNLSDSGTSNFHSYIFWDLL